MDKLKRRIYVFKQYFSLLRELVSRDIKLKYRRSVLGILWTVLNPLLMMLVQVFVFSNLFQRVENYPLYLMTGTLFFSFNSEATRTSLQAITGNFNLINKIYVPKYLFVLSKVATALVNMVFSLAALVLLLIITKSHFYFTMLLLPFPILYLLLFSTGLSLLLGCLNVFFRDLEHLYSIFILAWTYLTPLFYPIEIIPERYRAILYYNPMNIYITYFRDLFINGVMPSFQSNIVCFAIGIITLIAGILVFYKKQNDFYLYM